MSLKKLGQHTIVYSIGNMLLRGVGLFLIPIFTYVLTLEEFGLLSSFLITIEFLIIPMSMGMRDTFVRFFHEYREKDEVGTLISVSMLINITGVVITSLFLISLLRPFFRMVLHQAELQEYVFFLCGAAASQALFLQIVSYFRAQNQSLKFMLANLVSSVLLLVTNLILLLYLKMGIKGVLYAQMFSYGLVFIFIYISLVFKHKISLSLKSLKQLTKFGIPLIFTMSGNRLIGVSNIYILSYFAGLEAVGIYALGSKIAKILGIVFILPFQLSFQPYVYKNLKQSNIKEDMAKIFTYLIFILSFSSIGVLILAKLSFPLLAPPTYGAAFIVLIFLLPSQAFKAIAAYGEGIFNIAKKTHISGILFSSIAVFSIILNYLIVPILGYFGSIITNNIAHLSLAIFTIMISLNYFPLKLEKWRTGILFLMFSVFICLAYYVNVFPSWIFVSVMFIVAVTSLFILFLVNFFDKNEQIFLKNILINFQTRFAR